MFMEKKPAFWFGLLGLVVFFPGSCLAQENLEKKLLELGNLTGNEAMVGKYKQLLANKEEAKKLVAFGQKYHKESPSGLNYTAAFILAGTAKSLDDIKASAVYYRICTREAAKLESTEKLRRSYFALIDLLYDNRQYAECAKVCREVLELETGGDHPRVVKLPLVTQFGGEMFVDDARFDSAQSLKPLARIYQVQAITKLGKFDEALKQMDQLLQASDHWQIKQIRAWVLREAGRFKDAAAAYEEVMTDVIRDKSLEAEERQEYEDRYHSILSNMYVDLGEIKKATEQLRALVDRNPKEPGFYNDLGYIMADHDMDLKEAEQLVQKALELDLERRKAKPGYDPKTDVDNGAYLDSMGWVLFKQKRYQEAKEWLLKAVKDKNAQHIEIYDHLGDVHQALGETEAALAAWKRGVDLAGESSREKERKTRVLEKIEKHSGK
jgi:tetratricopeptide (TPR) repeat protein